MNVSYGFATGVKKKHHSSMRREEKPKLLDPIQYEQVTRILGIDHVEKQSDK